MVVRLYELFSLFCLVERAVEVRLNILGALCALIMDAVSTLIRAVTRARSCSLQRRRCKIHETMR